jgi:hypothetical protein
VAEVTSNIDEVERLLEQLVAGFNFLTPGKDESLGKDLAGVAVSGIVDRSTTEQVGPDGQAWADTEPAYTRAKIKYYGTDLIGVRTGQMLSEQSVMGETTITADEVTIKYGTGNPPTGTGAKGVAPKPSDLAVTDREKAGYFEAGGRRFFGLDTEIGDQLGDHAGGALKDYLS